MSTETNKKVKRVWFHQGLNFIGTNLPVASSIEKEKHKVEMELLSMGVRVRKDGDEYIVPVGIIHLIQTEGYDV